MPTCPMCGGRAFEAKFCKKCGMPEPEKVEAKRSASSIRGAPGGQRMTMDRLMKARSELAKAKEESPPAGDAEKDAPRKLPERAPSTRPSAGSASVTAAAPPGAPPSNEDIMAAMSAAAAAETGTPTPAAKPKTAATPPEPGGFVPTQCSACGEALPSPPPKFCDHCGTKVPVIKAKKKKASGASADEELKLCRNCGTRMPPERTMCPNCGTPQKSED